MKLLAVAALAAALVAVASAQTTLAWTKLVSNYSTNAIARHVSASGSGLVIAETTTTAGLPVVVGFNCASNPCTQYGNDPETLIPGNFSLVGVLAGEKNVFVVGVSSPLLDAIVIWDCRESECFPTAWPYQSFTPVWNVTKDAAIAYDEHSQRFVISRYNGSDVLTEVWNCSNAAGYACDLWDTLVLPDSDPASTNLVATSVVIDGDRVLLGSSAADRGRGRIVAYNCDARPCAFDSNVVPAQRFPGSNWAASMAWSGNGLLAVGAPNQVEIGGYRGAVYVLACTDSPFTCEPYFPSGEPMVFLGPLVEKGLLAKSNFAKSVRFETDNLDSDAGYIFTGAPNLNQNQGVAMALRCSYEKALCIPGQSLTLPDDADAASGFDGDGFGADVFAGQGFFVSNGFDVSTWVGRPVFRRK